MSEIPTNNMPDFYNKASEIFHLNRYEKESGKGIERIIKALDEAYLSGVKQRNNMTTLPIIKHVIIKKDTVFLFTENPDEDIKTLQGIYEQSFEEDIKLPYSLGFELPVLYEYTFLGNKYKCIALWFDNEGVPWYFLDFNNN